jgi:hypothetical protein
MFDSRQNVGGSKQLAAGSTQQAGRNDTEMGGRGETAKKGKSPYLRVTVSPRPKEKRRQKFSEG